MIEISNRLKHGGGRTPGRHPREPDSGLANGQRLEATAGSRASCRFGPLTGGGFKVSLTTPVETNA